MFFLSREQTARLRVGERSFWRTAPATVQDAKELALWNAVDEADERWVLMSDAAIRNVIWHPVNPEHPTGPPAVGEKQEMAVNWWVSGELPSEAFAIVCRGRLDATTGALRDE